MAAAGRILARAIELRLLPERAILIAKNASEYYKTHNSIVTGFDVTFSESHLFSSFADGFLAEEFPGVLGKLFDPKTHDSPIKAWPHTEFIDETWYVEACNLTADVIGNVAFHKPPNAGKKYDAFISHASENKAFVRPLVIAMQALDKTIWYDEFELRVGDSLRRSIDKGLLRSRFGVVVLSRDFFAKEWPKKELDGLVAREDGESKVILPIWLDIEKHDVRAYSPLLADRLALHFLKFSIEQIAKQLAQEMI